MPSHTKSERDKKTPPSQRTSIGNIKKGKGFSGTKRVAKGSRRAT